VTCVPLRLALPLVANNTFADHREVSGEAGIQVTK
jgi:hypothetical protein